MKWTYSIKNKLTAAALLAVVLGLVFINNIDERNNSDKLRKAFTTIYEDRMVVEGYIFDLSESIHAIQNTIDEQKGTHHKKRFNEQIAEIKAINDLYAKTTLTEKEETEFILFTNAVKEMENSLNNNDFEEMNRLSNESLGILYGLSKIQLAEANRVKTISEGILNYGKSSSQFEMALLIVIAIIIQGLVFASPRLRNKENIGATSFN